MSSFSPSGHSAPINVSFPLHPSSVSTFFLQLPFLLPFFLSLPFFFLRKFSLTLPSLVPLFFVSHLRTCL
ncbi:hypothetical protein IE53DRAFT_88367 [Violaceomyces palustris]|uniref:Uncharacterized protein n=1 Tax=Violaceomyces palustris TaxID=1673888 RepID=A0ACD0NXK9_9BASI|nr:hypothetical protein IE53DRAFT_88367 [Violaceomyces palustris]